jgi:Xaa-Pro aminopeptidase
MQHYTHNRLYINMHTCTTRLKGLRELLKKQKFDGFVVPSNDDFQSEFCPPHARRLEWLCGFSGSYGVAVILANKAAFFTDGRYTLQAKEQVSVKDYEHYNIADKKPWEWLAENLKKGKLALDPWLHTKNNAAKYLENFNISFCDENPIDILWHDRPQMPQDEIKIQPLKYAGQKSSEKIDLITKKLQENNAAALILAAPDSICWLLNIRGNDIPTTPFILSYAIVYKSGVIRLFIDRKRINDKVAEHLGENVKTASRGTLTKEIKALKNNGILIDPASTPFWFFNQLKKQNLIEITDPCQLPKACKNKAEIAGSYDAHVIDGVAVTKFLYWLESNLGKDKITELMAVKKLFNFRSENKLFIENSFDTISGFESNGAIVHYRASEATNREIKGNSLFLLDSGGQYQSGTTDITRTIAIGTPTKEQKNCFTLVLKGHIALASAVFPAGSSGSQLDVLARQYLWAEGLDYDHGTGHGVGSYLSVHEGPQRISKLPSSVALQPGMIVSNEPGYYKEGKFGIRIENLVTVIELEIGKDGRKFYGFDTITRAPIDLRLVDFSLLTEAEKKWLNNYHKKVFDDLSPSLEKDVKAWLKAAIKI